MAPDDLKQLTRRFHRFFEAEVRYPTKRGVGPGQELTQVHDLGRGRLAAIVVISGFGQTRLGSGRTWDTFV